MPTRPFDHGCSAAHSTTPLRSLGVLGAEVVQAALRPPGAAQVHHHHRVAARGEVAGQADRLAVAVRGSGRMRVPSRSASVPWYGLASRITGYARRVSVG